MALPRETRVSIAQMRKAWAQDLPLKLKNELRKAVIDGAEEVAAMQRRLVPVDQGDVRDSINVSADIAQLKAYIVAGDTGQSADVVSYVDKRGRMKQAFHAIFLEFGTRDKPARSFFWPAWRARQKDLKARFRKAFAKAIKDIRNG